MRDIAKMEVKELHDYGVKVSMSDLDRSQKELLYSAIEDRELELRTIENCEYTNVICSEVLEGEL